MLSNYKYFLLALCMWREARGEGTDGMKAVGCVIRNNIKNKVADFSWIDILLHPFFISSLTAINDPEERKWPLYEDVQWAICLDLALGIISGSIEDITNGATHYFATSISKPEWAKDMALCFKQGHHEFYK